MVDPYHQLGYNIPISGLASRRHEDRASRTALGLWFDLARSTLYAAAVYSQAAGVMLRGLVVGDAQTRLSDPPTRTSESNPGACGDDPRRGCPSPLSANVVAEHAAALVHDVLRQISLGPEDVAIVGWHGGTWCDEVEGRVYREACAVSYLAELTSISILDDFPSRDLACGGAGGPVEAAGLWVLLADHGLVPGKRYLALAHLAETVQIFSLPPRTPGHTIPDLYCQQVIPGTRLLEQIARHLVHSPVPDWTGSLAVQGRRSEQLCQEWEKLDVQPKPPWQPDGLDESDWLEPVRELCDRENRPLEDYLCSAVHGIAESVARTVRQRWPRSSPIGQLLVSGPGAENGFLLHVLERALPEIPVQRLVYPATDGALRAAAIAVVSLLYLDHVAANPCTLTGTRTPRVLGRLNPGSPRHWQSVVASMYQRMPQRLTLRVAI